MHRQTDADGGLRFSFFLALQLLSGPLNRPFLKNAFCLTTARVHDCNVRSVLFAGRVLRPGTTCARISRTDDEVCVGGHSFGQGPVCFVLEFLLWKIRRLFI